LVLAAFLVVSGWRSERQYQAALQQASQPAVDQSRKSLKERLADTDAISIEDRETGMVFPARPDQTLLEAIEAAGIKINYGCRSGLCGADPIVITEGSEHLSAPSADETATLRRLGLEGRARLACVCQTKGPIAIDRDIKKAAASRPAAAAHVPAIDRAKAVGITRVVIIGNGVAGMSSAEALRRESPSLKIDIVTDEAFHFYNRMALGRLIYGRAGMDGLHLLPEDWYGENKVEVWRNTIATAIDRPNQSVHLGTGEDLPYDRLILATGARPMLPDKGYSHYRNAFVLRTAEDAQAIRRFIQNHGARTAVVIGGGVLGIEAADALHHLGLEVTVLHRNGWLMDRQLDLEGALKLTHYLQGLGIKVISNARIKSYDGSDHLRGIMLASGISVAADLFIACMGAVPNADLARASGLEIGRGIIVDTSMRTSDPNIFAVGDVVELPGAPGGLWPIASLHAAAAAACIFGDEKPFETPRLLVQLKCDGIDLRSFGQIECADSDRVMTAHPDSSAWWRIVLRGDTVMGGVFVGPPGTSKTVTKLFQSGSDKEQLLKQLKATSIVEAEHA
jgi:NAD(P)H-nitrite reductase large subunit/ferredoxin